MTVARSPSRARWLTDGDRRRTSPLDVLVLAAAIAAVSSLVKVAWPRFTFWGDNAESFFPLWHIYGRSIRAGTPALFQADGWGGGNVVGEAAYGVFNPVVIVNSVLVSLTDDLSLASFLVMTEFLCLLGVGVYLLARSYGADRASAFTVGMIMPFAGYTLYYEASNWASGLMSITWVCWFWWASHEYARGRRGPIAAIITGVLAATVGNPYAVLGMLVVLLGLAVQAIVERRWRPLLVLALMGATVGVAVVAVYLPLLYALPVSVRIGAGAIGNDNYLTPGLGDLLGMSSPSFRPRMNAWNSPWDAVPSTYLGWIVLPLLPWLRWRAAFAHTGLMSVAVSGGVFLLLSLGPQNLWLFQWPIRFVEYTFVAVLVVFAFLLRKGVATDRRGRRTALTAAAVVTGLFAAWASRPDEWGWHLGFAAIAAIGVAVALAGARFIGTIAIAAVVVAGTAVVAPLQTQLFAWDRQEISAELDQLVPVDLATLRANGSDFEGTVLQVAALDRLSDTDTVSSGLLSFGNNRAAAGLVTVNRYTGIGLRKFAVAVWMDYRGSMPQDPLPDLFEQIDPYGVPLIEAMGVDTLVVNDRIPGFAGLRDLTPGWTVIQESPARTVLRAPWAVTGTLTTTQGLSARELSSEQASVTIGIDGGSGRMLLPRLNWPGYTATASDGTVLPVRSGPAGLVEIDVPEGTRDVVVSYEIPGIRTVIALAAVLVIATALQQVLWWRGSARRAPRRDAPGRAAHDTPDTLDRGARAPDTVPAGAHSPTKGPDGVREASVESHRAGVQRGRFRG